MNLISQRIAMGLAALFVPALITACGQHSTTLTVYEDAPKVWGTGQRG